MRMNQEAVFFLVSLSRLAKCMCSPQQNLDNVDTTNLSQLESVKVQSPLTLRHIKTELSQLRVKIIARFRHEHRCTRWT